MSATYKSVWTLAIVAATGALSWALASAGTAYVTTLCILAAFLGVTMWLAGAPQRFMGWLVAGASVTAGFVWALRGDALDAWPFLALALGAVGIVNSVRSGDRPHHEEAVGSTA